MGDEEDASSLLRETAEEVAQVGLRGEIEGVGWLVEEEHLGGRDEGAANHDATLLAGGHFAHGLVGELGCVDLMENFVGAGAHGVGDGEVGPEGGTGEEAGEDSVAASSGEGLLAGKFGRDNAEALFEFGEVPAVAAEDAYLGFRLGDWVALAGDGLDEGGLTAAVGAEDGDVLAGVDGEIDVVEDDVLAAGYVYVGQMKKRCHGF